MKNLKKVLAFVTMLTMLLSVAVSAGTLYPDVDDNATYAEAVKTLKALGIMQGDDKGNFNPEASITRAETAAVVTRMKNLGGAASAASGTNFEDVPASHWAAGYINLAEQSGIINGYGDGNFGPEDAVTYEQIIKMIVAALGRTPEATNKGGYPSGYLIVASQERITDGVAVTPGAEAPRAAVARLVYNALEVEVMEQVTYKAGEEEYQVIADKTLLKDYLKVTKFEGVVTDTYLTQSTVDPEDDKIQIDVVKVNGYTANTEGYDKYIDLYPAEGLAEGETDAASMIGKSVSAYAKEDEETGDMVLFGIAEKSGKNKTIVMDETQIEAFDGEILQYFENETDSSATKVEIDPSILVYNNGYEDGEVIDFIEAIVAGAEDKFGTLTLIDYDNDDVYDTLMLSQATDNYVVETVNASAKSLEDKDGNNIPLDVDDEDVITKIYNADGTPAEFADIAKGNVITFYNNDDAGLITAYISTNVVEGTVVEEISATNAFVIGDAEYKVAYDNNGAAVTLNVGDEGTFYINVEGKIVAKVATAASGAYAYLYKAMSMSDINGQSVEMKYLTSDGEWETRTLASKVTVRTGSENAVTVTVTSAANDAFAPLMVWNAEKGSFVETDDLTNRVFQFKLNDAGQIKQLFIADGAAGSNEIISKDKTQEMKSYSASQNKVGSIYLNDETKVFNVPESLEGNPTEEDFTVTKASALFVDGTTYDLIDAYDIENNIPKMVVAYGASADILQGTKLLVISKKAEINNASGSTVLKLYGYQEGVEVNALTSDELSIIDREGVAMEPADLKVGDATIFSLNSKGEIDKIQVLMSRADAKANVVANAGGFAEYNSADEEDLAIDYFGFVAKKANGLLYLDEYYAGLNERAFMADVTGEDEIALMTSNAKNVNVYEINLNNSNNTVQVLKGISYIDAETRYGKDSHWAYVRVYDDAIVDIVVYRTTNPDEVEDVPEDEVPGVEGEVPGEDTPVVETPGEDTPADTPGEDTPADTPVE